MNPYTYAGWFVIDIRLMIFVVLISLFTALGIMALMFKGKHWHEYVTFFLSVFFAVLFISIGAFNALASYPVFSIEEFFPLP